MTKSAREPDSSIDDVDTRRLHLVSTSPPAAPGPDGPAREGESEPVGEHCFHCDQPAVERVDLIVAHLNHPPRPPVALCALHRDRHASGAEGVGWCDRGGHHGRSASYCETHLGTIV